MNLDKWMLLLGCTFVYNLCNELALKDDPGKYVLKQFHQTFFMFLQYAFTYIYINIYTHHYMSTVSIACIVFFSSWWIATAFQLYTPLKYNMSPKKGPSQKERRKPSNQHFSWALAVSFRGSIASFVDIPVCRLERQQSTYIYICQGLNSHCFPLVGDKLINLIVTVYIPIISHRIHVWFIYLHLP